MRSVKLPCLRITLVNGKKLLVDYDLTTARDEAFDLIRSNEAKNKTYISISNEILIPISNILTIEKTTVKISTKMI